MAGHLIRRLHQRSTQVFLREAQRAGLELTQVQFAALETLSRNEGIDQAQLAALIAYDRATIGGVVERLERKALLRREVSPRDRRARVLTLTPEGRALIERFLPVVAGLQDEILSELTPEERRQLHALMGKALGPDAP
ncbi:MarR family transcriptional regulator [Pseudooceanicola sp. CBS1P-1]|uniref:MarR family transcriptional regulator n=2 Tax=Paracoccaceae TaxID=31989 RepID=A0A6L7G723_9RHOB|nr:MarR family transcriptional regulator [Pseudooceanicola endophyticus]MXN19865.1 MarR family transcriptional regulator [Pseudooceanicola albus]